MVTSTISEGKFVTPYVPEYPHQSGRGALDDPAPWQHLKGASALWLAEDFGEDVQVVLGEDDQQPEGIGGDVTFALLADGESTVPAEGRGAFLTPSSPRASGLGPDRVPVARPRDDHRHRLAPGPANPALLA